MRVAKTNEYIKEVILLFDHLSKLIETSRNPSDGFKITFASKSNSCVVHIRQSSFSSSSYSSIRLFWKENIQNFSQSLLIVTQFDGYVGLAGGGKLNKPLESSNYFLRRSGEHWKWKKEGTKLMLTSIELAENIQGLFPILLVRCKTSQQTYWD